MRCYVLIVTKFSLKANQMSKEREKIKTDFKKASDFIFNKINRKPNFVNQKAFELLEKSNKGDNKHDVKET